jgi:hypothetical protein
VYLFFIFGISCSLFRGSQPGANDEPCACGCRSRVPAAGRVTIEDAQVFAAALDVERGIYYRRSYLAPSISTCTPRRWD